MKAPCFTQNPRVQDPTAYAEYRVVSREELSLSRQRRSDNKFRSRQDLLDWGKRHDGIKFAVGEYLAIYLKKLSAKSILSLGCGECYHEYAIKLAAPEIKITATDFDPFVVEKVRAFLPEIDTAEVFDIKQDDFSRFQGKYDTVLMIGVDYVLSDDEVVDFLKKVSIVNANHFIMISDSYIASSQVLKHIILSRLSQLKWFLLRWEKRPSPGRFIGWARSRGEFVRLARMAGTVKLHQVITGKPFNKSQALLHIVPTSPQQSPPVIKQTNISEEMNQDAGF